MDAQSLRRQRKKIVLEAQSVIEEAEAKGVTPLRQLKFAQLMKAADALKLQEDQLHGKFDAGSFVN